MQYIQCKLWKYVTASKSINILLKATNETSLLSFIDFCNLFHVEGAAYLNAFFPAQF